MKLLALFRFSMTFNPSWSFLRSAVDLEMARRRSNGGRAMVGNEDRYSARFGGITDPRQYLSPLCFRSLGGRLAQEVCARRGGSDSLCGRYHPRFPTSG